MPVVEIEPDINASFEALYCDHHGWLFCWLRKKLDCHASAADLAQDTFVRILLSRRSLSQFGDQPRALLTHIAKGLVVDHWRHQSVERAYLDALAHIPEREAPTVESQLIIIEALTRIDAMLNSMPARSREMFLLAQLDGLTLKQISERTQTPIITVRRHIRKALLACMTLAQTDL